MAGLIRKLNDHVQHPLWRPKATIRIQYDANVSVIVFIFVVKFCILATSKSKMGIFCCEFPTFLENDLSNVLRKKEIRENFAQSFVFGGGGGGGGGNFKDFSYLW